MAEQPPRQSPNRGRCHATWALPEWAEACDDQREWWGPLDPSAEFMASGLSGLVSVCGSHQSALAELQRLDPGEISQDSTLWSLYWASSPESHPAPEIQAVSWLVADVNVARLRHLDGWQSEANALIGAHGTEAVEQHMATVRSGLRSKTMLADVPVSDQLMMA